MNKKGGRKAGVPNKVTGEVREMFTDVFNRNVDQLDTWIKEVGKNDPAKAVDLVLKLAEYIIPKLSRQEIQVPPEEVKPLIIRIIDETSQNKNKRPPLANREQDVVL